MKTWTTYPSRTGVPEIAGCLVALALLVCAPASAETWESSRLITPPDHQTKALRVYGAAQGGFHFSYLSGGINYMRYTRDGAFSPVRSVFSRNFCSGPTLAEAGGGAVWIVFEDWASGSPNMGATHSYDGGVSWSPAEDITGFGGDGGVKFPSIAPFGGLYSHQMVATTVHLGDNSMYYNVWDGFKFTGIRQMPGSRCNSEYWATGSARAADGSVYRSFGHDNDLYMNVWNGTSWAGETRITYDNQFFAWPDVAGNDFGLVCFVWERDERVYASVYTPGHGFGPTTDLGRGRLAAVTGIPGRNDFYVTFTDLSGHDAILGRRWAAGAWQPPVLVSAGIPRTFTVQSSVCADRWGTLYCVFEYWGSGGPQTYFNLCRDFESPVTPTPLDTPPTPPPPTITPTFTATHTATVTLTPTVTNTPRDRTPTRTPTKDTRPSENLKLW